LISFVPDEEAHQLALSIATNLRLAGWKVDNPTPLEGGFYGVLIFPSSDEKDRLAYQASKAIAVFLGGCYIQAAVLPALRPAPNELIPVVDDKTLRIIVGLKPFPEVVADKVEKDQKELPKGNPIDVPCKP